MESKEEQICGAKKHGKENLIGDDRNLYAYPERLMRRRIKNGSSHISLHKTDELDNNPNLFRSETVYTFTPPDLPDQ